MKYEILNLCEEQADCFLINIENDLGDSCNILVDGNKYFAKYVTDNKLIKKIKELDKLDVIIITHIDNDHLGGILSLYLNAEKIGVSDKIKDTVIIYNYITKDKISYKQAEKFEKLISNKLIVHTGKEHYNNRNSMLKLHNVTSRNLVMCTKEKREKNAYLTFLSPDKNGINEVISKYQINEKAPELINKNSIAFLLEFGGKRSLFLGDCLWEDIEDKVQEIKGINEGNYNVNLVKLPHHGAKDNNKGIIDWAVKVKCNNFLVSGKSSWDQKHPSEDLILEIEEKLISDTNNINLYTNVVMEKSFCFKEDFIKLI